MADYYRIIGSKEKIGIILSTTDQTNFVVEAATVHITFKRHSSGTWSTVISQDKGQCTVDNKNQQKSHKIEYLWECSNGGDTTHTAEFSAKLSDGQVIVRSVTIAVS